MAKLEGLHAELVKAQFQTAMEKKGYDFFGLKNENPYNVNIIGVRSNKDAFDRFDDFLVVIYRDKDGEWEVRSYPITTDPGKAWLESPISSKGTAVLVPNQYRRAYKIAKHQKKYDALCQVAGMVEVYRDTDRDSELDRDKDTITEGWFGINIHRSRKTGESELVGSWSAGCQVFKKADDFNDFMEILEKSADLYGNLFTYTLILESDLSI